MISVCVTIYHSEFAGAYQSVGKIARMAAVPRTGDYLSLDDLEDELTVSEVHFGLDGKVGVSARARSPMDIQALRASGWTDEAT